MVETGTTAALVGVIIVLTRIVEWQWKKYNTKNGNGAKVSLHPEQQRQLREVHEKLMLLERDVDDMKSNNGKIADALAKVADCMEKVSETSEKVAEIVEKIDRRQEIDEAVRRRQQASPQLVE
jgi:peptidoglycan hydrolase CwlO-like protein